MLLLDDPSAVGPGLKERTRSDRMRAIDAFRRRNLAHALGISEEALRWLKCIRFPDPLDMSPEARALRFIESPHVSPAMQAQMAWFLDEHELSFDDLQATDDPSRNFKLLKSLEHGRADALVLLQRTCTVHDRQDCPQPHLERTLSLFTAVFQVADDRLQRERQSA